MVNICIECINIVYKNPSAGAFCLPGCVCLTTRHSTSTYLWIHNNAFQPKPDIFLSDPSQIIALSCQSLSHSLLFVNLAQGLSKVIFLKDAINLELFLGGLLSLLDEFY